MTKKIKFHNIVDHVNDLKQYDSNNVCLLNNKICLVETANEGYIESEEFETNLFDIVVGSWACITNTSSSCELQVKVCVKDTWSKYFTYGKVSLGSENFYEDDEDDIAKIYVDEIIVKNGLEANKVKYKVILRRNELTDSTPQLSLVALTMHFNSYEYKVENHFLPSICEYNVPKLNQNMVPVIGKEMCSATTTAMLLKFYGFDFSDKDSEFEHRYVASLVADPGHNNPRFGNWVYNTAVMGGFGLNAYVGRMYSWEELKQHLATVGPVGASIKGDTGVYKTGGHLIVAIGYKEVEDKTYVICNDPNINARFGEGLFVRYEYPLDVFMKFWRGVAYIIEK